MTYWGICIPISQCLEIFLPLFLYFQGTFPSAGCTRVNLFRTILFDAELFPVNKVLTEMAETLNLNHNMKYFVVTQSFPQVRAVNSI